MSLLEPNPPDSLSTARLALCLQAASLLITGFFVWNITALARWLHLPLQWLLIQSAVAAVTAWAISAAITFTLYALAANWERAEMVRVTLRTSAAAVWFAPAVILLSQLSPATLAGALILVVYTTRLLYAQWRLDRPESAPPERDQTLFASAGTAQPMLLKELAPALIISSCVQTGVIATLLHYPLLAAAGYAMSVAVLTVFAISSRVVRTGRLPTLPRSIIGVFATVVLAVMLTVGALTPRIMHSFGWGEGPAGAPRHGLLDAARAMFRELVYEERPGAPNGSTGTGSGTQAKANPAPGSPAPPGTPPGFPAPPYSGAGGRPPGYPHGIADDGFPGVILWPEIKPYATLIAPMPPMGTSSSTPANVRPISIPFSGEYWMFRSPFARPPQDSYFQRGNPATLFFHTTDHGPLQMEAHHRLDQLVDLRCCRAIQLIIRNADHFPGTVTVELVLLNSEMPRPYSQSLGQAVVTSKPDLTKDPVVPVTETLEFTMPAQPTLEAFDEFKVLFHRAHQRVDKSARVAIDRFVLISR